jgi:hypothetical protein
MRIKYLALFLLMQCMVAAGRAQQGGERRMEEAPPFQAPTEVKRSMFRQVLNKVTLGISTGYGHTFYRQNLEGYAVFKRDNTHFLVPGNEIVSGRVNKSFTTWLSNPVDRSDVIPADNYPQVAGDTLSQGLAGHGQSLPLNISLHVNLINRIKVGGGFAAELHSMSDLRFAEGAEVLGPYMSQVKSFPMLRYYGMLGVRAWRWYFWDFTVDTQIGKKKFLGQFNQTLLSDGFYYNFGLLTEKHFSEYFRLTLRPSVEWSSYTMALGNSGEAVTTNTPAVYLQAGISLNYPRLPRCPITHCHVQLEHVHFGKEYRGQPIHRWQNPKYGQNHPELMRNKKRRGDDTEQKRQYKKKRRNKFFLW